MELTELKEALKELATNYKLACNALEKKYALERAKYKVGDIITDSIGSIKIEAITVQLMGSYHSEPKPVYFGIELKKDLTPTKKGMKRHIWQSSIK